MSAEFACVFFTRTRTADVVHTKDVYGKPEIGHILKVRWNGRTYAAKVMCVGSRKYCESQVPHILTDGSLVTPSFEVCERNQPLLKALFAEQEKKLEELSSRLISLFRRDISEMKDNIEELLRRVPTQVGSEEDALSFAYVARDRMEALRRLCGGNMNRFALHLEKEVYMDDPEELALNIGKRVKSAKRVDFIRAVSNVSRYPKILKLERSIIVIIGGFQVLSSSH
ncbi:unnamed protein product [Nippostrongylus brasiliensis]|uniref:Plus3 domain-containing protein n=1 Tax=Nippostrongylus brasiliensis TaxID=27835 RepID=A0A0N4XJS3_NIPBR|nr:unnamed protein product [Nippostrongylus brasiliensis]